MVVNIIWAVVALAAVAQVCYTAKQVAKITHPTSTNEIKALPEVDEHGEKLPTFDDIIATIYGREEEHE